MLNIARTLFEIADRHKKSTWPILCPTVFSSCIQYITKDAAYENDIGGFTLMSYIDCTVCSAIVEPDQISNVNHWYVALLTEKRSPILLLLEWAQFGLFPMETSFSLLLSHWTNTVWQICSTKYSIANIWPSYS